MKTIYIYLLDSMAEWEIGNILQAVSMEKAVRKEEPEYQVKTFGLTRNPVKTIGGLRLIPDLSIDEIIEEDMVALLLPGGETWSDKMHDEVLDKAEETLKKGTVVGAICGATLAIAERGLLDKYKHTSNSIDYLSYFSKTYQGHSHYVDTLAVSDQNLITASVAGGLEWAKLIVESLKIYPDGKTDLWYKFFKTGKAEYYMHLIS